jgi:hypothetical protein
MSRSDRIALFLSLIAILVSYWVTIRVFQSMAHIEDEMAYVWQAQAIARGHLTVPSPPEAKSFLVPFVVDYNGQRFGKYPLGWPIILAVGVFLGLRSWVNPLLAGLGVWLTYRLGQRVFGEAVGLLAAALTITSPFFLMNSGSLLSHPLGLVLSAAFALAWLDAFWNDWRQNDWREKERPRWHPWLPTLIAGLSLGVLALTRPLTAVAIGLPFGIHGIYLLFKGDTSTRWRVLTVGLISVGLGALLFVWQYAVTGDPLLNPYTLWWPYDKLGFGPDVGNTSTGHTLHLAYINTRFSIRTGLYDLFGWSSFSWIFLPFGLLSLLPRRKFGTPFNGRGLLLASVFVSNVLTYTIYWIGSYLFGPRYYYESLYSLTLLTAAGFAYLAGWPTRPGQPWRYFTGWWKARPLLMTALLALLVSVNLVFYAPMRVGGMYGLYGISRERLEPFQTPEARALTPALIIVHPGEWTEYGALLDLEDPFLDTPFIFVFTRGEQGDRDVAAYFPNRHIFYYYTDQPYTFYTAPRPPQ